ncbi:hypothetical protein C0Q70_03941 [Pomacea canaliculata]|uniref:Uncharacterized protein n=1 Tax=Pomacea canaliculata TaxID=400727 RepID=A0A2T7PU59_POMCA|nr:hypothetical protein C0Q70_03941 [Pomacea canaliculata]
MADDAINTAEAKFNRDAIMKELNDKGYCVIPDVLTSEECDVYTGKLRDWLSTFGADEAPYQQYSIINSYRVGHLEPTWEVRLKVKSVFQTIWQTDKLLSSFDSVAIAEPPEKKSQEFHTPNTNWFHMDQIAIRVGLHGYQGAVYLEETSETDYCFRYGVQTPSFTLNVQEVTRVCHLLTFIFLVLVSSTQKSGQFVK